MLANNVGPDQTPRNVAPDLGLHCFPMTLSQVQGKNGLLGIIIFNISLSL